MKNFWFILFILFVNTSFAQKINTGGFIDYTVTIAHEEGVDCTGIRDQLNSFGRMKWMYLLNKSLKNGNTIAYRYLPELNPEKIFDAPINHQELKNLMVLTDTIYTIDGIIPINGDKLNFEDITKIRFIEKWSTGNGQTIEKKIIAFAPVFKKYSEEGKILGEEIHFWLKPDAITGLKKEILITERIEYRVALSDTIPTLPNTSDIQELVKKVKNGKLKAFPSDLSIYDDEEQSNPISPKDIYYIFNAVDTVFVPDSINPDILIPHTFPHSKWISQPIYIDFREKWILHPQKGLTKLVNFYSPFYAEYDRWGQYLGLRRLFWIK